MDSNVYFVIIEETLRKRVKIIANSAKSAMDKSGRDYQMGKIVLDKRKDFHSFDYMVECQLCEGKGCVDCDYSGYIMVDDD